MQCQCQLQRLDSISGQERVGHLVEGRFKALVGGDMTRVEELARRMCHLESPAVLVWVLGKASAGGRLRLARAPGWAR